MTLCLIATFFVSLWITKPINDAVLLLKDIAQGEGDLSKQLIVKSNDETAELAHWFNQFIDKLTDMIVNIKNETTSLINFSGTLSHISREISDNSNDMSSRMELEAASLAESSATLVEMSQTTKMLAEQARKISHQIQTVEKEAIENYQKVESAVRKIQRIEEGSQKVAGIASVITEIANQTNLLSLNAAIEAAKAGEQGKGFSVVADEVRILADRSNHSADDIRTLIEETVSEIASGATLIREVGESFKEIQEEFMRVSRQIEEFENAITEQEQGVNEITQGVEEITEVSSQNVESVLSVKTIVEEVVKGSDELSRITKTLQEEVNQFKLQQKED